MVRWQIFIGHRSAWFPLSAMCLCIVKAHFYRKIEDMLLNLHEFAFYIVRRARLRLELFASTVGRFLSRMSYLVLVLFSSGVAVALL